MKKPYKYSGIPIAAAVLLLFVLLSYYRDIVFRTINAQITVLSGASEPFRIPGWLDFISGMDSYTLEWLKWILTIGFALLFLLLSAFTVFYFFRKNIYMRLLIFAYIILMAFSLVIHFTGKITGNENIAFLLSRKIMHFLQSPLVVMVFIPVFLLQNKIHSNKGNSPS